MAEAPRGTLLHHYRVDGDGIVQWANLVIATGHNNLAMNRGVAQVARHYVKADRLTEPMLNRVEAAIRCYDPCLSCSTHAIGQMPLHLRLLAPDGSVLDERDGDPQACPGCRLRQPAAGDDGIGWHAAELLATDPRLDGAESWPTTSSPRSWPPTSAGRRWWCWSTRPRKAIRRDQGPHGRATSGRPDHLVAPPRPADPGWPGRGPLWPRAPGRAGKCRRRIVRRGRWPLQRRGAGAARGRRGGRRRCRRPAAALTRPGCWAGQLGSPPGGRRVGRGWTSRSCWRLWPSWGSRSPTATTRLTPSPRWWPPGGPSGPGDPPGRGLQHAGPAAAGGGRADTIAGIVEVTAAQTVVVVGAALTAAVAWNIVTWRWGLPSSSAMRWWAGGRRRGGGGG